MRYVAFLRAINVGGHTVTMKKLSELFEAMGLRSVETFLASGNVTFTSPSRNIKSLQKRIEAQLEKSLGYEVKTFIRTESELAAIAEHEPFISTRIKSATALNVAFLSEPMNSERTKSLIALKTEIDDLHVNGSEVYWLCQKKQSESDFSNSVLEKALKIRSTLRGIQTVTKLAAKLSSK